MTPTNTPPPSVIRYFIDEAGDPTLFDKRGRQVLVGNDASKYFMLGKLKVTQQHARRVEWLDGFLCAEKIDSKGM